MKCKLNIFFLFFINIPLVLLMSIKVKYSFSGTISEAVSYDSDIGIFYRQKRMYSAGGWGGNKITSVLLPAAVVHAAVCAIAASFLELLGSQCCSSADSMPCLCSSPAQACAPWLDWHPVSLDTLSWKCCNLITLSTVFDHSNSIWASFTANSLQAFSANQKDLSNILQTPSLSRFEKFQFLQPGSMESTKEIPHPTTFSASSSVSELAGSNSSRICQGQLQSMNRSGGLGQEL